MTSSPGIAPPTSPPALAHQHPLRRVPSRPSRVSDRTARENNDGSTGESARSRCRQQSVGARAYQPFAGRTGTARGDVGRRPTHAAEREHGCHGDRDGRQRRPATTRAQPSTHRRQRPPRLPGTRSSPRSGAFDSPARLGGTDPQQITQQLCRVAVAGVASETTALGLGDRGDHGRTQSPPVALGFDESAQQVDIGQFRPAPCRRLRCQCSRMCVHAAERTPSLEHMFDKSTRGYTVSGQPKDKPGHELLS